MRITKYYTCASPAIVVFYSRRARAFKYSKKILEISQNKILLTLEKIAQIVYCYTQIRHIVINILNTVFSKHRNIYYIIYSTYICLYLPI